MNKCYSIEIKYNDFDAVSCASDQYSGLCAHLSASKHGTLYLKISCKIAEEEYYFHLKAIMPGDSLAINYIQVDKPGLMNIANLERYERATKDYIFEDEKRLGVVFVMGNGKNIRCSYPAHGNFYFICANVHLHHARSFVMSGNKEVNWKWQFENLYPDNNINLTVVETNWCNVPRVIKHYYR